MAVPRFVQANIGRTITTGNVALFTLGDVTVGNILIAQVFQDGTGTGPTLGTASGGSPSGFESLSGTALTWTSIGTFDVGATPDAKQHLYIARATATDPTPTCSTPGDDLYARFYEFADCNTGTTLADVIENSTAGSTVNSAGTSNTIADAAITTLGADRLACQFIAVNDDNAISAFSGGSGGRYAEADAEYASSTGTDGCIALNISTMGSPGSWTSDSNLPIYAATGTNEMVAQSFASGSGGSLTAVTIEATKTLSPTGDLQIEIQTDSGGVPSGTAVGTGGTFSLSDISSAGVRFVTVPVSATLASTTTYWIVISRSGSRDATNYPQISHNTTNIYGGGVHAVRGSGTWTAGSGDLKFMLSIGSGSTIDGSWTILMAASDAWGSTGFALIGESSAPTPSLLPPSFRSTSTLYNL